MAQLGLLLFKIGDSTVKSDWIYVDNLVLALILASMGLLDDLPEKDRRLVAAGQAYFVSDGNNLLLTTTTLYPLYKWKCLASQSQVIIMT